MHLGVSMWSYVQPFKAGTLDVPGFIRKAKEAGAEGVELLDFFYRDIEADRAAALEALAETGLPCPIFSISQNFAKPDPADREAQLQKIRFGVEEALHYGSGVVRVFAGDVSPEVTFDQARAWIVEGLAAASIYAEERGIKLALENHGSLAGRADQVRGLIADARAIARNEALGANPDTGNFLLVNQLSHEAIRDVADLAKMVHFKDFIKAPADHEGWAYTDLRGQKYLGTAVGEGEVDLPACIQALKGAGYEGWLSIEFEGNESPYTAIPRSIANARRLIG